MSTDGGYGLGYDKAYNALYELLELLDEEVIEAIAHENFEGLIRDIN